MSVVTAEGLSLTFPGDVQALKGVNLSVDAGEFVSFIGPSGCGKDHLSCASSPTWKSQRAGRFGSRVSQPGRGPDAKRAYGYVFQQPGLLPWRTVEGHMSACRWP